MKGKKERIDVSGGGEFGQNLFGDLDRAAFPEQTRQREPEPKPAGGKPSGTKNRGRIEIRREKAGRGGKTVTTATGFSGACPAEQQEWVRELKRRCGSGGTFRAGAIEIQGDRRNDLMQFFTEKGFRPVLAGG